MGPQFDLNFFSSRA